MSEKEFFKEKDLLLNSIEKNTVEHWENYYSNVPIKCIFEDLVIDINEIKKLTNENQELKNQLETLEKANKQLISKLDRYDAIVDERDELKKKLEENQNPLKGIFAQVNDDILLRNCGHMNTEINEFKNQQKEFIEYLESEINKIKEQIKNYNIWHEVGTDINFLILKKQFNIEILSNYKEIIGGKDE